MPVGISVNRRGPSGERYNLYFNFPGHANRREGIVKWLRRRDALGGQNLNVTNTQVWFGTEDQRDPDFFGPIGSFPTRIYVTQDALYRVTYNLNATNGAATSASIKTRCAKNGGAGTLVGSMSGTNTIATTGTHAAVCASFLVNLVSGDYIEVVSTPDGGSVGALNTVASGCTIMVELVSLPGEAILGGVQVITRASQLLRAILTKGVSGYSGTTSVRVLKNGLSIMGSNDLEIASSRQFAVFPQTVFANYRFDVGDVVSLDVISEEAPYPRDLGVTLQFTATNG